MDVDLTYLPVYPRPESFAAIDAAMQRIANHGLQCGLIDLLVVFLGQIDELAAIEESSSSPSSMRKTMTTPRMMTPRTDCHGNLPLLPETGLRCRARALEVIIVSPSAFSRGYAVVA